MGKFFANFFDDSRRASLLVAVVLIIVSHIIIPTLNNNQDFFIFSSWSLFSNNARQNVYDISWDNGETYLLRNHRALARRLDINLYEILYLLNQTDFDRIKGTYLTSLEKIGDCPNISIYKIESSLFDHIFKPETAKTHKMAAICD